MRRALSDSVGCEGIVKGMDKSLQGLVLGTLETLA